MFDNLFNSQNKDKNHSALKAEILAKRKEHVRLSDIPVTLQKDSDIAKFLIEKYPEMFRYLPISVRKDIELSSFAVSKAQYNAAYSLCEDEDYLLDIINKYPKIVIHMKDKIKSPHILQAAFDIAVSSVSKDALDDLIGRLPLDFFDNEYCARKLLDISPLNMHRLSKRIQNNKKFLMESLNDDGNLYSYLTESQKKDLKFIQCALKTCPQLIFGMDSDIQRKIPVGIFNKALNDCYDNSLALKLQKLISEDPVEYLSPDVLDNPLIAKTILSRTASLKSILLRMSLENRGNKELVTIAVTRQGTELEGATYKIRSDLPTVLIAIKQNYEAFQFLTSELLENKDALKQILATNGLCYKYISERRYDEELLDIAMQSDPAALVYAPIVAKIDTQYHLKYFFRSPTGFDSFMATSLANDAQMLRNFEAALSKEAITHPEKFVHSIHRLNDNHKHYEAEYRGIQWMLQYTDKQTLVDFKTEDNYLNNMIKAEISRKEIIELPQVTKTEVLATPIKKKRKVLVKP